MSSLSELLTKILELPLEELKPRTPESERPNEMALTERVLSKEEIEAAKARHPLNFKIKRACHSRTNALEMEFLIPNGGLHKVVASYGPKGLLVTHNDQAVQIGDSVEEFREYLLGLAQETKNKAGAP